MKAFSTVLPLLGPCIVIFLQLMSLGLLDDEIEEGFELGKAEVFGALRQILREKVQERCHIGWCQCFNLMVCIELLKELENILISPDSPWLEGGSLVVPV